MREALRPPPRPSLRLADRSFTDEATLAEALRKGGPKMHAELADNLPELVEWAWTGPRGDPGERGCGGCPCGVAAQCRGLR